MHRGLKDKLLHAINSSASFIENPYQVVYFEQSNELSKAMSDLFL